MKTRIAPLVIALVFLSALIISDLQPVNGQGASIVKQIRLSRYGVVLSIPGPNGKGTFLRHEGYAIAYRAKNPKTGGEEDRLAYAFGDQQVSNLEPVKQERGRTVARTRDGALEVTSEAKWDENLHELKTLRSVKVTAATDATILAVESHADAAQNTFPMPVIRAALMAEPEMPGLVASCGCPTCTPSKPCLQGFRLSSGEYLASLNMIETPRTTPTLMADSVGMPSLAQVSKGDFVSVLSWTRGVNLPSGPSAPGDGISYFVSFEKSRRAVKDWLRWN